MKHTLRSMVLVCLLAAGQLAAQSIYGEIRGSVFDPSGAVVAEAHAPDIDAARGLIGILHHRDVVLHPVMNIQEAIAVFDAAEAESLAVVEADGEHRPVGILTEAHAMRRYAEESDKRRREAIGEV